ncbi:hypothetical protein G7Y89_g7483 [Cudoniella acicularis]|uniref:Uncharacterized protein n=1 Tax=Cudoniella acicularis TaxID=354080 RepID=A0A8H4RKP6_9HELO|nr:hypothetical protein G7Y89_g7483 [Cudoniella acicularis]
MTRSMRETKSKTPEHEEFLYSKQDCGDLRVVKYGSQHPRGDLLSWVRVPRYRCGKDMDMDMDTVTVVDFVWEAVLWVDDRTGMTARPAMATPGQERGPTGRSKGLLLLLLLLQDMGVWPHLGGHLWASPWNFTIPSRPGTLDRGTTATWSLGIDSDLGGPNMPTCSPFIASKDWATVLAEAVDVKIQHKSSGLSQIIFASGFCPG